MKSVEEAGSISSAGDPASLATTVRPALSRAVPWSTCYKVVSSFVWNALHVRPTRLPQPSLWPAGQATVKYQSRTLCVARFRDHHPQRAMAGCYGQVAASGPVRSGGEAEPFYPARVHPMYLITPRV